VSGQTSASFYPVKQAAPRTARHLLAEETGKFSPENLRDKMPRKVFYPAFHGSGFRLHSSLRSEHAARAIPIGARLYIKYKKTETDGIS